MVVFGVPLRGSLLLLIALTLLFLLNTLGLGLLVSTLVGTQQQAMMFCRVRPDGPDDLPLGPHLPDREHARGFQIVTYVIPVRYYANILRGDLPARLGLGVLWPEAAALLAGGSLVLTLASLRFRKSLD